MITADTKTMKTSAILTTIDGTMIGKETRGATASAIVVIAVIMMTTGEVAMVHPIAIV